MKTRPSARSRRWFAAPWVRSSLALLLLGLLIAGAAVWWHRDLPRRLVREAIAERLGADVSLGRLQILGTHSFRLHELCLRQLPGLPHLELLCIGRLDVEASLDDVRAGRFDRLHAHDARARLQPPSEAGPQPPPPAVSPEVAPEPLPQIGELQLDTVRLTLRSGSQRADFDVEGNLLEIGSAALRGRLALTTLPDAPSVPLAPLFDIAELPADASQAFLRLAGQKLGPVRAEVQLADGQPTKLDVALTLDGDGAVPILDPTWPTPFPLSLQVTGHFEPPAEVDSLPAPQQLLPPIPVSLDGQLSIEPGPNLPTLTAEGRWPLNLREPAELAWRTGVHNLSLTPLRYAAVDGGTDLQVVGPVSAAGTLTGTWTAPELLATVSGNRLTARLLTTYSTTPWRLRQGRVQAQVSWSPSPETSLLATPLRIRQFDFRGEAVMPQLAAAQPVALTLQGDVEGFDGPLERTLEAHFRQARLRLPGLGELQADGDWQSDRAQPLHVEAQLDSEAFTLETIRTLLHPDLLADLPLDPESSTQASYGGSLRAHGMQVQLDALGLAPPAWSANGPLEMRGGTYTSADYSRVVDGLDLDLQLEVASTEINDQVRLALRLTSAEAVTGRGLQLLWGTVYANFSGAAPRLDIDGHIDGLGTTSLPELGAELATLLTLHEGPTVSVKLQRSLGAEQPLQLQAEIDWPRLGPGHRRYLQPTFPDALGDLDLDGRLHLSASARLPAAQSEILPEQLQEQLYGQLRLEDVSITSADQETRIVGVALDLPFDLRRDASASTEPPSTTSQGSLAFQRFRFRGLEVQGTRSPLVSERDSVRVTEPLVLPLFDGHVELRQLALHNLLDAEARRIETAIQLHQLQLERVAETLGLFPLEGSIDGQLPHIILHSFEGDSGGELTVEGGGEISVFGGSVRIGDISGRDILTGYPRFVFSADFDNIDLLQFTRRLDFGEMTGSVEGQLRDCELFRGTPVRFQARLRSVEENRVPRTVSVKAVRNLTVLGTGAQSATLLDRGLQRLFDRYTYASLGVEMELNNDVFLLRGLERRGDKELFLRGRLPLPIDVVNAQPGRTVSFQAMLRRLDNLDFSAVRTD